MNVVTFFKEENKRNHESTFLVFNTACLGDVLLCNCLIQNIKNIYPNSKVIFIADKTYQDIARYQMGVDDVIVFDKKNLHKGLLGLIKFIKDFPYKKADYSIITYRNERNYFISQMLGVKKILVSKNKDKNISMQEIHAKILTQITDKEVKNLPIKYIVKNESTDKFLNIFDSNKKSIALCAISKNTAKDFPITMAVELINRLNKAGYQVILTGAGKKSEDFANELKHWNCNFYDLVNQTTILELAQILKKVDQLISVDTGTMHLGYAVGTKTLCIFFEKNTKKLWAPSEKVYNNVKIFQNPNIDEIIEAVQNVKNTYQ